MNVNERELAVLQAVCDRISGIGQMTSAESVLTDLRNSPRWSDDFYGAEGSREFERVLSALKKEYLVEEKLHKSVRHLTITDEALRVEGLGTYCLML